MDHLQAVLDILVRLFDRVGLQTDMNKMVGMVYQMCQTSSGHSEDMYKRHMTEVGILYRAQQ